MGDSPKAYHTLHKLAKLRTWDKGSFAHGSVFAHEEMTMAGWGRGTAGRGRVGLGEKSPTSNKLFAAAKQTPWVAIGDHNLPDELVWAKNLQGTRA